ncbi:MAG TPA: hypothetical protein VHO48_11080 [Anaerolineaceae bacterium]|nr:hypothetical protein [Anaerolineaceae bacterium]
MVIPPLTLKPDYWENFEIEDSDLEFLYNHLLEKETPLTSQDLMDALINERIRLEKDKMVNQQPEGAAIYAPKEHYRPDDTLVFPAMNWQKGHVLAVRPGNNPEIPPFEVIEVQFDSGTKRLFAAGVEEHRLNQPLTVNIDDPLLNPQSVTEHYGKSLAQKLEAALGHNPDLVRIARRWFPRALLVDVNIGYLNLAEAVLDMAGGGPLATKSILEQIELPTDVNPKLTEFSLNLALQEDPRFDEVGPAGEILWYLQRLEPEEVRQTPLYIRYSSNTPVDRNGLTADMVVLEAELDDEWTIMLFRGINRSPFGLLIDHLIFFKPDPFVD